jgi:hypothetical protein
MSRPRRFLIGLLAVMALAISISPAGAGASNLVQDSTETLSPGSSPETVSERCTSRGEGLSRAFSSFY